jgi:hypothetical protein
MLEYICSGSLSSRVVGLFLFRRDLLLVEHKDVVTIDKLFPKRKHSILKGEICSEGVQIYIFFFSNTQEHCISLY